MQPNGSGRLVAFFRSLEEDAAFQRETGFAPNTSEEMRDLAGRVKKSFALPTPPKPGANFEERDAVVIVDPRDRVVDPEKKVPIHECKKCLRIFALKKTLAMHAKACAEPSGASPCLGASGTRA